MSVENINQESGLVFNVQRWSIHDGPGVRTVVFLKGCPMRCAWCCNPEAFHSYNELVYFNDKCIGCKRCLGSCIHGAIREVEEKLQINREVCSKTCYREGRNVFPCTSQCYGKALDSVAKLMTVTQVMNVVMRDELIYKQSKVGGLTLSGGEPLLQPLFCLALLKEAKSLGITTAIETCGVGRLDDFENMLQLVDYLYVDIKIGNQERHKKFTGIDNKIVFHHAILASQLMHEAGKVLTIRIPLIPTISTMDDFELILNFVKTKLAPGVCVEIMPYHRLGRGKYSNLGMDYSLAKLEPCKKDELGNYKALLDAYGFGAK